MEDIEGLPLVAADHLLVQPLLFRLFLGLHYVDVQREQFKRLGVLGDWDDPYLTLRPKFEAKQIEVFGAMANKGYICRGCPSRGCRGTGSPSYFWTGR